jgi:hypothetical protein
MQEREIGGVYVRVFNYMHDQSDIWDRKKKENRTGITVEQLGLESKLSIGSYVTATIVRVIAFSTAGPPNPPSPIPTPKPQISHDPSEPWGRHRGMGIRNPAELFALSSQDLSSRM